MKITSLFLLILLASLAIVTSVASSTYNFSFEIVITGPEGMCSESNILVVGKKLTFQVGLILNQYFTNNGLPGNVANITLTSDPIVRFLGEANAHAAVDAFVDEPIDDARERKLAYIWRGYATAVCRLCLPSDADARRTLRGLQTVNLTVIPKEKIDVWMNSKITPPTQNHIQELNFATAKCRNSSPQWSSVFKWL